MVTRAGVIGGVVGSLAAVAAGGLAAERYIVKQRRNRNAPPARDFDDLAPDRTRIVHAEDGVELHVEEVGPLGAPLTVVFLHGYTLSLRAFYFQRRDLAERFGSQIRMVFYDQRSHGRSGASVPAGATMEQLGRDLFTVLEEIAPAGPVVLVGHSMGGMAIQHFAGAFPQYFADGESAPPRRLARRRSGPRIIGVALVATSSGDMASVPLGLPALFGRVQGPITGALLRTARRRANLVESGRRLGTDIAWLITRRLSFGDKAISPDVVDFLNSLISATPIIAIADFFGTLMDHDGAAGLQVLQHTDVVIIVGELDVMTPVTHSERIAEALPKAKLVRLDGVGHVALMERPDDVDEAIGDLVQRALDEAGDAAKRRG